jgi:hypothetical protein
MTANYTQVATPTDFRSEAEGIIGLLVTKQWLDSKKTSFTVQELDVIAKEQEQATQWLEQRLRHLVTCDRLREAIIDTQASQRKREVEA